MCFEIPVMMTFVSRAGGNMECGFGESTSLINQNQRLIIVEDPD